MYKLKLINIALPQIIFRNVVLEIICSVTHAYNRDVPNIILIKSGRVTLLLQNSATKLNGVPCFYVCVYMHLPYTTDIIRYDWLNLQTTFTRLTCWKTAQNKQILFVIWISLHGTIHYIRTIYVCMNQLLPPLINRFCFISVVFDMDCSRCT